MKEKDLICQSKYIVKAVDQPLKKLLWRLKDKSMKITVTTVKWLKYIQNKNMQKLTSKTKCGGGESKNVVLSQGVQTFFFFLRRSNLSDYQLITDCYVCVGWYTETIRGTQTKNLQYTEKREKDPNITLKKTINQQGKSPGEEENNRKTIKATKW